MSQTRIVLREDVKERAEHLLKITQLGTFSELIAVLITRYGNHLETTWEWGLGKQAITEENQKRRWANRLNHEDATNILERVNLLNAWLEGNQRLSIKELQACVRAISENAANIQSRLDSIG